MAATCYSHDVTDVSLYRHEAKRCGPAAFALPALVVAAIALLCYFDTRGHYDPDSLGSGLIRLAVAGLALASGLAAASAVSRERMLEVQLTLPTSYPVTIRRRVLLVGLAVVLAAGVLVVVLAGLGLWSGPGGLAAAPVRLLGPAMLPAGVGVYFAIASRSAAAGSTAAVAGWLAVLLVWNTYVQAMLVNTGVQLIVGLAFAVLGIRAARDTERLLTGGR